MLGWLAGDFAVALLLMGLGYRLARVPVVPHWLPRTLLWPLRRFGRREVRLQGVSAFCSGACVALVPLTVYRPLLPALGGVAVLWAAAATAWVASVWVSNQPEPGLKT